MQKRILILFICSFFNAALACASNPQKVEKYNNKRPALFYENKGQVVDQNRNLRHDVRMIFDAPGFKMVLTDKGMSYEFIATRIYQKQAKDALADIGIGAMKNKHLQDSIIYESQRIDIDFVNANPSPKLLKEGKSDYYENYYTEYTGEQGVVEIYGYSKFTLKDVWKNIDIEYIIESKNSNAIKYNFIVRPGGNIKDIQLKYNGATPTLLSNTLQIKTGYGELTETIPAVYYKENTESVKPEVYYELQNGIISFSGKNINTTISTLVIDPNVVWATYYGGAPTDVGQGITPKDSGFVYMVGRTGSNSYIATNGSFMTSYKGNDDAFITKFTDKCNRIWATYYGGNGADYFAGIITGDSGNIYVTGNTWTDSGLATSGAYQIKASIEDILIAKFTSKGKRIWATYYGGNYIDYSYDIAIDDSNNIYITGETSSTSGIATSGTYQTKLGNNGISSNAFIVKFSSGGNRIWGTYFGGKQKSWAWEIAIENSGNLYITGTTSCDSGIATKGAYDTLFGGVYDGFIAKFSNSGNIVWATYVGGSKEDDLYSLSLDASNIYIVGYTYSDSSIATVGAFKTNYIYNSDAFLAKYSKSGNRVWTSYFGDSGVEYGVDLCVDNVGDIYISGSTSSIANIASNGTYQTTLAGKNDVFLTKFSNGGTQQWATYYGGEHDEFVYDMKIYEDSFIYITGITQSKSGVATKGAFKTTYGGVNDAFLVKFYLYPSHDAGISKVVSPYDTTCSGSNLVQVLLHNYDNDSLLYDSIYWEVNGVQQTPVLWNGNIKNKDSAIVSLGYYNFSSGKYTIKAWSARPNGEDDYITRNDTTQDTVTVKASSSSSINVSICQGKVYSFAGKNLSSAGMYYDTLKNYIGCDSVITLNLNVNLPSSSNVNLSLCQGDTFNFGGQYLTSAGTYYDTLVNAAGCDSAVTLNIKMLSLSYSTLYKSICQGTVYMFGGDSITLAGSYFDTLANSVGCDSIITLHLIILQTSASTVNKTLCLGDIYNFGGTNISTAGTYYHTFTNNDGCDSVVTLNVIVNPVPATPTASGSPTTFCEGDSVVLSTGKYINYLWSTGEHTQSIIVKKSGNYSVQVRDSGTCSATSNIVSVVVYPLPVPVITNNNRTLQTGNYISYQWYLNGSKISNATSQIYTPTVNGSYQVFVTDNNGCTAMSAAYTVGWTGIISAANTTYKLYPNPTNNDVYIEFNSVANRKLYIYDSYGRLLQMKDCRGNIQTVSLNEDYADGIYLFVISGDDISRTYKVVKNSF